MNERAVKMLPREIGQDEDIVLEDKDRLVNESRDWPRLGSIIIHAYRCCQGLARTPANAKPSCMSSAVDQEYDVAKLPGGIVVRMSMRMAFGLSLSLKYLFQLVCFPVWPLVLLPTIFC